MVSSTGHIFHQLNKLVGGFDTVLIESLITCKKNQPNNFHRFGIPAALLPTVPCLQI